MILNGEMRKVKELKNVEWATSVSEDIEGKESHRLSEGVIIMREFCYL